MSGSSGGRGGGRGRRPPPPAPRALSTTRPSPCRRCASTPRWPSCPSRPVVWMVRAIVSSPSPDPAERAPPRVRELHLAMSWRSTRRRQSRE
eukprot:4072297-Pyramimonas_sp.AAC.1